MDTNTAPPRPTMHQQSSPVAVSATFKPRNLEAIPQRVGEIAMLRGLGYSYREIGRQFSVTPQAVSLMLSRHRRAFKSLGSAVELSNLSARAVNALGRHGIKNREQARNANVLDILRDERNCGRKTLDEIAHWLDGQNGEK
jgi:hypothetical protein